MNLRCHLSEGDMPIGKKAGDCSPGKFVLIRLPFRALDKVWVVGPPIVNRGHSVIPLYPLGGGRSLLRTKADQVYPVTVSAIDIHLDLNH